MNSVKKASVVVVGALMLVACGENGQQGTQQARLERNITRAVSGMEHRSVTAGSIDRPHPSERRPQREKTEENARDASPTPSREETPLMKKMGLEIEGDRIILDTRRSKAFFEELGRTFRQSMEQGVKKIETHTPSGQDLGIYVGNGEVVVDLNRTRDFLEEWVESMEVIGRELERSLQPPR